MLIEQKCPFAVSSRRRRPKAHDLGYPRSARVPRAREAANSPTAATPSVISASTSADPTMAPSAYPRTSRTCSAVEIPRPTQLAGAPALRRRSTRVRAAVSTSFRAPVMPIVETAYTKPRLAATACVRRSSVELGAARNTRVGPGGTGAAVPRGCLRGKEIGIEGASPTRRDKIIGKPVDAVLKHEIPVRHDEHRGRDLLGDACDRGEDLRH